MKFLLQILTAKIGKRQLLLLTVVIVGLFTAPELIPDLINTITTTQ